MKRLIRKALPDLRQIVFHSDGKVTAKTGARAKYPKKLYSGKTVKSALKKLIKEKESKNDTRRKQGILA